MLLERIEKDLKEAIKSKDEDKKNALRIVKGEIPRLNLKAGEKPTNEQIQQIITKLIKSETLVIEYSGQETSPFIEILESYLPQMMNKAEIQQWIMDNINIGDYNPIIKAMGPVMKHLKGKADGNMVKNVLTEMSKFGKV